MIYTISAFASSSCDSATHRSGEIALGTLSFASANGSVESFSGNITSARPIPFGAFITLTATDNQGNSSEFSPCLALTEPAPFVVSKTADTSDGVCNADCSLREAIIAANAQAGADRIHFNIPAAGVQSIAPTSPLPALTGQTLIDGYTQPGAAVNTATTLPGNAQLRIELNGVAAGVSATGLVLQGAQSVVRGLVINRFDSASVSVQAASVAVQGCIIGTNATASVRHAHTNAVVVAAGASNALIGGKLDRAEQSDRRWAVLRRHCQRGGRAHSPQRDRPSDPEQCHRGANHRAVHVEGAGAGWRRNARGRQSDPRKQRGREALNGGFRTAQRAPQLDSGQRFPRHRSRRRWRHRQ
ncbi:MAG: CSLREA domain-containing protein [Rhodanobacteraceae bacterium]|nr:CSLREA domain-containing protein [Rhodanobacteraceae bacterium]